MNLLKGRPSYADAAQVGPGPLQMLLPGIRHLFPHCSFMFRTCDAKRCQILQGSMEALQNGWCLGTRLSFIFKYIQLYSNIFNYNIII
jgi:hypothetical protein